jgi:hypothetical protein
MCMAYCNVCKEFKPKYDVVNGVCRECKENMVRGQSSLDNCVDDNEKVSK